jgi:hypothetical protein
VLVASLKEWTTEGWVQSDVPVEYDIPDQEGT